MSDSETKEEERKSEGKQECIGIIATLPCLTASTLVLLLHVLTLANLEGRLAALLVVDCRRAHAVLDLLGHGQEGLLNVGGTLGRRLEERNVELVGKLLGRVVLDNLLVHQV